MMSLTVKELIIKMLEFPEIENFEVTRECDFGGDRLETSPIRNMRVFVGDKAIVLTTSDRKGETLYYEQT